MGDEQCIFCAILSGRIPSQLVAERAGVVAFRDVHPQAPTHVLVVPRRHVASIEDLPGDDPLWNELITMVREVVESEGLSAGYRVVINHGADGGQTVNHLHLHVLGGRAFIWPPG
jgi:histidine triad (HIT) family protein